MNAQTPGRIELLISYLLRGGVVTSLAVVLIGTAVTFVHHPSYTIAESDLLRLTHPDIATPHTPRGVIDGLREFQGQAIVTLGLLILIATPILRVAASVCLFLSQRDVIYVIITCIVLSLLLLSLLLGSAAG